MTNIRYEHIYVKYPDKNDFAVFTTNQFYSDSTILSLGKDKKAEECKSKELTTDPCGCCKVLATPTLSNWSTMFQLVPTCSKKLQHAPSLHYRLSLGVW